MMRAIRGPIMLITVGVLFLVDYFTPYPFYKTFPVLLIIFGVLKLLERMVSGSGSGGQAPTGGQT
ncbi:MAG: DUF5668 domain-containing protein [Bryobacteraceae bacterium]